jgi:hypothetical protein
MKSAGGRNSAFDDDCPCGTRDPKTADIKTLADLVAMAKTNPGIVGYGSAGNGNITHLAFELLSQRAGIQMQHIRREDREENQGIGRRRRQGQNQGRVDRILMTAGGASRREGSASALRLGPVLVHRQQ